MKGLIFSPALLFFFSTIAFAQANSDPRFAEFPRGYDAFPARDLQSKGVEGGWPDNNPVRDWSDKATGSTVSLKELQHKIPKALVNLDRAAPKYPEAHIAASNLLIKVGRTDEAARHLEAYLRSPQSDNSGKAQVQARLAQLRE